MVTEQAKITLRPWVMTAVRSNEGRSIPENSLVLHTKDRGYLYLDLSIPSQINVMVDLPEGCIPIRDFALFAQ